MIRAYSTHDKLPNPIYCKGDQYQIVKTPEHLVNDILDQFPKDIWSDKDKKWLIPFSKTGIFELNIYYRLFKGLKNIITDRDQRRDHIVKNMIWSFCPTEATMWLVKSEFIGKVYNDIYGYSDKECNIYLLDFNGKNISIKNGVIMARKKSGDKSEKADEFVKFDCVVGNPPFQESDGEGGKGASAKALYPDFVNKCLECNPQYFSMVIPGKWMIGAGKGTKTFLKSMLKCKKISSITSVENAKEWFPDIELPGGAMYFLIDRNKSDTITNINGFNVDLSDEEYIFTDKIGLGIRDKILKKSTLTFDKVMYSRNPYGITSCFDNWLSSDNGNCYICHCKGGSGGGEVTNFVEKYFVSDNFESIDKWKVCLPKAYGADPKGTGYSFVIGPNHIVSETYLVMSYFDSEEEANNAAKFLQSRIAQYMVSLLKNTQNMSLRVFKYLPVMDFSKSYSDQELFDYFELSNDEIDHVIESTKTLIMFRQNKRINKK